MILRPYQHSAVDAVEQGWSEGKRQLIVLATGTGKTVGFAKIAQNEVAKGGRVLVIAHTDELIEQAIDKIFRTTGISADKEKSDSFASPTASIVVASVQTLARENRLRGFKPDHFSLVIVDECHRALSAGYIKILNYFHYGEASLSPEWKEPQAGSPYDSHAKVLGVTATPDRGDKRSLGEFFQRVAFKYDIIDAVNDGYLVRPIARQIPLKIDLRGVRRTAGDLNEGDVAERLHPLIGKIALEIKANAGDRKTVVFTPSIETARMVAEVCSALGMDAGYVSGQCHDRDEKIQHFDKAPNGALIACAVLLTEGWDCPSASCVCILRPTKIRSLYVQCAGRALRPLPGIIDSVETKEERIAAIAASPKKNALLLDFLWIADRMDLIAPIDIVVQKKGVRDKVRQETEMDLIAAEEEAERDLLKSLEIEARKHAKRKGRTIDPLAFAVALKDPLLTQWEPANMWDELPPTPEQINALKAAGMDTEGIRYRGLASVYLAKLRTRAIQNRCTPKQMSFLIKIGISESAAANITFEAAGSIIGRKMAEWKRRSPSWKSSQSARQSATSSQPASNGSQQPEPYRE